ncbi:MAG: LysR family transcriptional regulator [Methanobrevibacter sp.]|uniref:LysR family transcriptional regulator n=1 Tax=Methanobrevibacter sp. TaxID=66852 RepID=UPI0026E065C9|nr:LysR family transcriptional regulator [Methanobrevibacter sp.]MDO5848584.1 LysR family transcriptional regulator [Methanobrevibacter sp.]
MNFKSKGLISLEIDDEIYDYKLYDTLKSLSKTYSQRKSAKELGISHAVLNRRIKKAEDKLGIKLVDKIGSGSVLTKDGIGILNEFQHYYNQISKTTNITIGGGHIVSGLLESISQPYELSVYSSNDLNSFKLAERGVIDILALDDPLIAFEKDLNFTPIGFDYLVLITNKNSHEIKSINDLSNLNFVSVAGSAQRLAWNTLEHYDINYNISKTVNSQFDAFKMVKNSDNLYSFLNASYFKGSDILKHDTRHAISLVQINEEKEEIVDFIEFLLNDGQKEIIKQGFSSI